MPGIARGFRIAAKSWAGEADFFRHDVLDGQMPLMEGLVKGEGRPVAIRGTKGRVVRIPSRTLLFVDNLFKGVLGTMEAGAQAHRIGRARGLRGKALEDFIAEEVNSPGSESWIAAVEKATDHTFQTDIPTAEEGGGPVDAAVSAIAKLSRSSRILGYLFPFIRTPYNIFRTGIRKTPLGAAGFLYHFAKSGLVRIRGGKAMTTTYPNLVRDASEQVLALMIGSLLYGMAEGDDDDDDKFLLISGSPPKGFAKKGLAERDHGGAYVIRIGGITIPYGRVEPLATTLGTMVDMVRAWKGKGSSRENMEQFYGWMSEQVKSKTFMKGVGDILRYGENPDSFGRYAKRWVLNAIMPNIVRQPLRNADQYVRDSRSAKWWYDLLPLPSGALPAISPATGKPVEKAGNPLTRQMWPSNVRPDSPATKADRLLTVWNRENPSMSWAPANPDKSIRLANGKRTDLPPKAVDYLARRTATLARKALDSRLTAAQIARPTEDDFKSVRDAYEDARATARAEVLRLLPTLTR
jgi:hypothetical protein